MPPEQSKLSETKEKLKKDRKVLNPQAKELIINVVNFMKKEASGEFIVPARKVQCRAALATGFSERTVRRVVKESRSLVAVDSSSGEVRSVSFPPKKIPNRPKPKTGLDDLTRCTVRKMIHKIYTKEKTVPTVKKIHQRLIHEIGFKGGTRSAHKIVKELGFVFKKTNSKSYVLIEKNDIRIRRIEYLREIIKYRREGRPIVYVGATYVLSSLSVHEKTKGPYNRLVLVYAGGERGFVPNASLMLSTSQPEGDYHDELSNSFYMWMQNVILPALPSKSVIVFDTATQQYIKSEKIPTSDSKIEQMKAWLRSKNISFNEDMLKPELHQIIKRHAPRYRKEKGLLEELLTEKGHALLKLPPEHSDLNPIHLIWAEVKNYVANENKTLKVDDVKMLLQKKLNEISPELWMVTCNQVRSSEQQYLECEGIVDHEMEKILTKPQNNREGMKIETDENRTVEDDEQHDNNNFAKHFMGGFLGIEEYKVFNA